MRCGKCWGEGHNGSHCKTKMLNPAAMPYWSNRTVPTKPKTAPATPYDELLKKPCPLAAPTMPNNRPARVAYFADRDPAFLTEIAKLNNAVVFNTHGRELGFKPHDIAQFAKRTKLVEKHEISIGILGQDKFLIVLPVGIAPETFINATSPSLWEAGFSFQIWSPLDDGRLAIPEYKVLLTLHNVPPHMRREKDIAGAISTFGVFLGTIPQEGDPNLSIWTVALAVDRLERIPVEIEMHGGGVEHIATTHVKNWMRSPLYGRTDLPRYHPKFSKPAGRPDLEEEGPEMIHISRKVLRSLCQDLDPSTIPAEIMDILEGRAASEITLDQARLVTSLPMKQRDDPRSQTGQDDPMSIDATQLITGGGPQSIEPPNFNSAVPTQDVASQASSGNLGGMATTVPKRIVPQKIPTPVKILQRPPTSRIPSRTISVQEPSVPQKNQIRGQNRGQSRCPLNSAHLGIKDKGESSKRKTCHVPDPLEDRRKEIRQGKQPQRPKIGPKLSKHITFKKMAQTKMKGQSKLKGKPKTGAQRAEVHLNGNGFYEVEVQYGLCASLGAGCGFQTEEVIKALQEDNQNRQCNLGLDQTEMSEMDLSGESATGQERLDLSVDSGEELETDEDLV